jgi:iron complex outermembrane receptor protein
MPFNRADVSASILLLSAVVAASTPLAASAQLEELIVTAERRETSLQQTPTSVQAYDGEDLRRSGIQQGRDVSIMVPNVVLNSGGIGGAGFGRYYVRGLPGVGIYIDGVWQGDRGFLEDDLVDLERVEVLRGPQGTLFGRNTNGGAVNIITRRPGDDFEARLVLTGGEFDRRDASLVVDFPLSETVKMNWLAARFYNDGFLRSLSAPRSLGGQDDVLFRGDVLWEPTRHLSLRLTLNDEVTKTSDPRIVRFTDTQHPEYLAYNVLAGNPDFLAAARTVDPAFPDPPKRLETDRFTPESHESGYSGGQVGKWETKSNTVEDGVANDIKYATLNLSWRPSANLRMEAIGSTRTMNRSSSTDRDGSELTITALGFHTRERDFSEEVHLTGNNFNGKVDWLAGLYYLKQQTLDRRHGWLTWEFAVPSRGPGTPELDKEAVNYVRQYGALLGIPGLAGFTPPARQSSDLLTGGEDEDKAFFGEVTIHPTSSLGLTLGARSSAHEGEARQYDATSGFRPEGEQLPIEGDLFAGVVHIVRQDPDVGNVATHKVAAAYDLNDTLMVYSSWAQGFTSSEVSYSRCAPDPIILDPEIVSTRELGLRSSWLNRRLRFNVTRFASRWAGLRVPTLPDDPNNPGRKLPCPTITSEGLAETEGWEFELVSAPGDRWRVSASVGLLDTRYLDIGDPDPRGINGIQPWSPFAYAPDKSVSVSIQYETAVARGAHVLLSASYGWMDEYVRAPINEWTPVDANGRPLPEPAYGVLNARIRFEPTIRNWNLEFWGRNLTDAWYVNGGIDGRTVWGYDFATIGASREVGVSLEIELQRSTLLRQR